MKKNILAKRNIIIIVLAILLLVIPISISLVIKNNKKDMDNVEKNKKSYNINSNIISEKEIEGYKITDVKVEIINGLTTYTAKAINTTNEPKDLVGFNIYFENKEKAVGMISIYINEKLNPNDSIDLINYSDLDLTSATDINYELIK